MLTSEEVAHYPETGQVTPMHRLGDDVILEPGMMSFHHPYVLHGAEPNDSGARRGGMTFRYMPSSSYYDREIEAQQGRQGVAYNSERQLHLVRGIDICGRNDIYRSSTLC